MGKHQKKHIRHSKFGKRFKAGRGRTIKAVNRQRGPSNMRIDMKLSAMLPGQRRSGSGNVYWETRKNRSDRKGSRI